jgi:hypothetical protein
VSRMGSAGRRSEEPRLVDVAWQDAALDDYSERLRRGSADRDAWHDTPAESGEEEHVGAYGNYLQWSRDNAHTDVPSAPSAPGVVSVASLACCGEQQCDAAALKEWRPSGGICRNDTEEDVARRACGQGGPLTHYHRRWCTHSVGSDACIQGVNEVLAAGAVLVQLAVIMLRREMLLKTKLVTRRELALWARE